MTTTYTFSEVQNIGSVRAPSATFEASDLAAAKRKASALRAFKGTVLVLEGSDGTRAVRTDGRWTVSR